MHFTKEELRLLSKIVDLSLINGRVLGKEVTALSIKLQEGIISKNNN